MSIFFEICTTFVSWSVRSALHVSTGLFLWLASCLKKKHFFNCISYFKGKFQVFEQIFSSTVDRSALVSRFFNRIYANFFWISRKTLFAGLSELRSTCPQDCFHGKHFLWEKHFSNIFSIFRRQFFRFSANLFQHGSQKCIGF